MKRNKTATNTGFTLIEVLIAITITGLFMAVAVNAVVQITQGQRLMEERMIALTIGKGKMAEITSGSEPGLSGDFTGPYQKFAWKAEEESMKDGSKKINLTVEWRDSRALLHQTEFIGYRFPE